MSEKNQTLWLMAHDCSPEVIALIIGTHRAPSAADLDAVMEERRIALLTN